MGLVNPAVSTLDHTSHLRVHIEFLFLIPVLKSEPCGGIMAGIAGINHIPKGRETQPASRPVGRATPEEPQESLHLGLTHTVLPLCAWTYLAIGAGFLEHPVEETQTDRLGMPWMRLDAAQPIPGAGREGTAIHLLGVRTERASLQAWSISKSYARACTGCPGLGEFSVLQIQSQTCPGGCHAPELSV